jgi:tetratricopeptide (TPR) repeat protein
MNRSGISPLLSIIGALFIAFVLHLGWKAYAVANTPYNTPPPPSDALAWGQTPLPRTSQPVAPQTTDVLRRELEDEERKLKFDHDELTSWQKHLEDRSKEVDDRSHQLEQLISQMIIGNAAYTFLIGVLALFGLKAAEGQAERLLNKFNENAKTDLDKFREEAEKERAVRTQEIGEFKAAAKTELEKQRVDAEKDRAAGNEKIEKLKLRLENDIPNLYGMQRALNDLLERIRQDIDLSELWTQKDSYKKLERKPKKGQQLLLAEMTIASLDYFTFDFSEKQGETVPAQHEVAAEIFAHLAYFYSARARVDPAKYDQSDLVRALIYINRALQLDPNNDSFYSQRGGLVLINVKKEGDQVTQHQLKAAERDLCKCLELNSRNARGLYNLAWIYDELGDFDYAINRLTQLIGLGEELPVGERAPLMISAALMISAYINRACAISKRGLEQMTPGSSERDKIVADCKNACVEAEKAEAKDAIDFCIDSLERERGSGGELQEVAGEIQPMIEELKMIKQRRSQNI